MKVLLSTDFSLHSNALVDQIGSAGFPEETEVMILHVIDTMFETSGWVDLSAYVEKQSEDARQLADSMARQLSSKRVKVRSDIVTGNPSFSISEYARRWDADLVMVGSYGHSALFRFLLGSVALSVLRHSPCSVEIARPYPRAMPGEGIKVLIATDGSRFSTAAVEHVARRRWPDGTFIDVLSVVEPLPVLTDQWLADSDLPETLKQKALAEASAAGAQAEEMLSRPGLAVTFSVLEGRPKSAILEEATRRNSDLIVVGSSGRRGLGGLVLGSVAEAVAVHAHCSVLVVRERL